MKTIDAPGRTTAAVALAFAFAALPGSAAAGLYKCELDSGITYQQTPCPPGRELRDFERNPATVSVVPFNVSPQDDTRRIPPAPTARAPATTTRAPANAKPGKGADAAKKAAERKFLIPGIYQGEVLARVGAPDLKSGSGRKTMRWTYLPAPDDPATITTLTFQEGRLIEVERKVVHAR
jgi:hypothetical protein